MMSAGKTHKILSTNRKKKKFRKAFEMMEGLLLGNACNRPQEA
jgi:hypothetical protein